MDWTCITYLFLQLVKVGYGTVYRNIFRFVLTFKQPQFMYPLDKNIIHENKLHETNGGKPLIFEYFQIRYI